MSISSREHQSRLAVFVLPDLGFAPLSSKTLADSEMSANSREHQSRPAVFVCLIRLCAVVEQNFGSIGMSASSRESIKAVQPFLFA